MPMVRTILPPIEFLLVAEYVLDTRAHPRARRVRRLLALRQRTISCGATVDMALQALVIGLAAGVALALLGLRLRHGLDVSTEILPWHDLLDRFQRIAQSANRIQPALNIEKALLPHDPLAPSAHDRVRSPSQIRGDLARGIFRGAHWSMSDPLSTGVFNRLQS